MTNNVTTARSEWKKACSKLDTPRAAARVLADAGPQAIEDRLAELESEWTAGRVTKAVIGVLLVLGFALTALLNPWWLILPAIGGLFLLQYLFSRTSWLGQGVPRDGLPDRLRDRSGEDGSQGASRRLPAPADASRH